MKSDANSFSNCLYNYGVFGKLQKYRETAAGVGNSVLTELISS